MSRIASLMLALAFTAQGWSQDQAARQADEGLSAALIKPQHAFAEFALGLKNNDPSRMQASMTEGLQDLYLYRTSPMLITQGKYELLKQHVDFERFDKLVRQELPVTREGMFQVFRRSIKDREAFFAALLNEAPGRARESLSFEGLSEVEIDGDRATGVASQLDTLVIDTYSAGKRDREERMREVRIPFAFIKGQSGWLIHDLALETVEKVIAAKDSALENTEPVTVRRDTPNDAWNTLTSALQNNDAKTAWNVCTPGKRQQVITAAIELMEMYERRDLLNWYLDHTRLAKLKTESRERDERKRLRQMAEAVRDPEGFFANYIKWAALDVAEKKQSPPQKQRRIKGPLRVTIDGDRARGVVTERFSIEISVLNEGSKTPVEETWHEDDTFLYFTKASDGWLVDVPTEDEAQRDEQLEKEREAKKKQEAKTDP